jgi:hypothetical protein
MHRHSATAPQPLRFGSVGVWVYSVLHPGRDGAVVRPVQWSGCSGAVWCKVAKFPEQDRRRAGYTK